MPPLTSTRTLIELRVGSIHTIEVLLQIRLSDIHWWNSNYTENECELYKLIGRRILPKECRHEIEVDRARVREAAEQKKVQQLSSKVDDEGVIVVEKRNSTKRNVVAENNKNTVAGKKRGGGATKAGKKESKATSKKSRKQDTNTTTAAAADTMKKQQSSKNNSSSSNDTSESTKEEKKLKLLRETGTWIMGTTIQLCYKMEDIDWSSVSTIIFRPNDNSSTGTNEIEQQQSQSSSKKDELNHTDDNDDNKSMVVPLASFRTWKKLPKRLVLWVFQFDPNDPTDLSTSMGGGFPRPELLPIADIFRSTTTGDDDDG
jgi:hypothetical protein